MHNKGKIPLYGWNGMIGTAIQNQAVGGGNLNVNVRGLVDPNMPSGYHIIDTDYDTYTIVYSCSESFGGWLHNDIFWVLAREQSISDSLLAEVMSIAQEKIPDYDSVNSTEMGYQNPEWCQYDDMPVTPDP